MNTNSHQPPQTNQPKTSDAPGKPIICRNFIWGSCTKHNRCKFAHLLDMEEMKKVLKFCHDFQNKGGCQRKHCTYLHTTREEQNYFFAVGQLPSDLAKRHAAMEEAKRRDAGTASSPPSLPPPSLQPPPPPPTPLRPPPPPQTPLRPLPQTPLRPPPPTPLRPPPPPQTPLRPPPQTPLRPPPPTPLRPPPVPIPIPASPPAPSLRLCSPSMQFSSPIPQMSSGNIGSQTPEFFAATMLSNLININNLKRRGQPVDEAPPNKRIMEGVHVADSSYLETRRIEAYKLALEIKENRKKEQEKKDLVKFLRGYFELDLTDDD